MDVDQAARTNAQEYFGVKDPDYYEFEGKFVFNIYYPCELSLEMYKFSYFNADKNLVHLKKVLITETSRALRTERIYDYSIPASKQG